MSNPAPTPAPTVSRSRFTPGRACISDVARLAAEIPLFPVERSMPLGDVAAARTTAALAPAAPQRTASTPPPPSSMRIGWAAIFLKAYALVAREFPVLRSWLVRGFPHGGLRLASCIATASESVATLAVNRVEEGEERLFWGRLVAPDTRTLPAIQQFVTECATRPVEEMFRRQLELEMVPGFLRRTILRWNMNSCSQKRAARIGTFSLSTLAGMGATNRFHPTICTTSLSYAPLEADGRCLVTLIADHRVLDGAVAARALARLEEVLRHEITAELRGLGPGGGAAAPARGPT